MVNNPEPVFRNLADKFRPCYADDLAAVVDALQNGLSGTSATVSDYERDLGVYFDSPSAIAVSSGAAAISVALAAAGVGRGDEVVLTPTAPLCTVYPVIAAGAVPVFVDTRLDNFGADLVCLDGVLSRKTKAIVDIPMWGYPTPVDELHQFARARSVPLILDLAHAHGTKIHGRHLSTHCDLACFSTHERKILATGEGGFVLSNTQNLTERCRSYSRFGNLNGRDFGLNFKLGALPAALGRSRLAHLDAQLAQRRRNAQRLLAQLAHNNVSEAAVVSSGVPNYYALNLRLTFSNNRRFIEYLEARGIPSDIIRYGCRCLYEFPAVAPFARHCPNAEALLGDMTTIPVHPGLTDSDLDYIAEVINSYRE